MISSSITIASILESCNGVLIAGDRSALIGEITIDSRKISPLPGQLFIAIKGPRNNGHNYLKAAHKAGIRNFLVSEKIEIPLPDSSIIQVENTTDAIQQIAAIHRRQFNYPMIAITGSNGKTTVKEWLNQLLADDHWIIRSPRSYNSQIGVPLSLLKMQAHHDLAIIEAGISQPGEMQILEALISPNIGVLTHIGSAHLENFKDRKALIKEKIKLFKRCEVVIAPNEADILDELSYEFPDLKVITWGNTSASIPMISRPSIDGSSEIEVQLDGEVMNIHIPFSDHGSIANVCTCIAVLIHLGYTIDEIGERLKRLEPIDMRMQILEGNKGNTIISDVYNSDLESLEIALNFLEHQKNTGDRVIILSDIQQSGLSLAALYSRVNQLLHDRKKLTLIGIGKDISSNAALFTLEDKHFFQSKAALMKSGIIDNFSESLILIKGSREFKMETVCQYLQRQAHDTILEVDLNAIIHNLNVYRSLISRDTKIMAMVKAFGYGSGGKELAKTLEYNGVDYLAVAFTDEGIALREAGVNLPIVVLNPEANSLKALVKHRLEPEIYNLRLLDAFNAVANELPAQVKPYPVHLKLDTGMHRLGFESNDLPALIAKLNASPQIQVKTVFSHLAASDDTQEDAFTQQQIARFKLFADQLQDGLKTPFQRHLANTSGIERFPEAHLDMVRLGIGLYGVSKNSKIIPIATLKSIVSQIKNIEPGDSVGYGRSFIAQKPTRIATIPIGYADGLDRRLSDGSGWVNIRGKKAPIVGRVCMDMTMVDVTNLEASEGDEVIIFGHSPTLQEVAKAMGTIPYEVIASLSARIKRVYLEQ